jgi:hypothetical protein
LAVINTIDQDKDTIIIDAQGLTPTWDIPRQKNKSMALQKLEFFQNCNVWKIQKQFMAKFSDFSCN